MIKKVLYACILSIALFLTISITAFAADDIELNSCQTTGDTIENKICAQLQKQYKEETYIKFNTIETDVCKYTISVDIDGVNTTVYISKKPYTGNPIIPGSFNEKAEVEFNLIKNLTTAVLYDEERNNPFVEAKYPYNQINERIISAFGEEGISVRYFLAEDINYVKANLKKNNMDEELFIDTYFYKTSIDIGVQSITVYLTREPNLYQRICLGMNIWKIFMIIIVVMNVTVLSILTYKMGKLKNEMSKRNAETK